MSVAVIIGATGLVGGQLLQKLNQDDRIEHIVVLARRPPQLQSAKIKTIVLEDFSKLNNLENKINGDYFFCCLGTTIKKAGSQIEFRKIDEIAVLDFAKIAKNAQARSFTFVSAQGADSQSRIFYNRVKGLVETQLIKMGLNRLIIFRPGLLLGNRVESRLLESLAIGCVRVMERFFPNKWFKSVATSVDVLTEHMIRRAFSIDNGAVPSVEVIRAPDIGNSALSS